MRRVLAAMAALVVTTALSACQSASDTASAPQGKSAALRNMEQVAIAAHRCWFASGDPAFARFSFANELNSFSGQPRILLVPHDNFAGRPLLVIQSRGPAGEVEIFGPVLAEPIGTRIRDDVGRWSGGDRDCAASA